MNNFDYSSQMQSLLRQHASAKRKMIFGIIFTSIGYTLLVYGLSFISFYGLGLLLIIPGIPFFIIGLTNLINGWKARFRTNRSINILKKSEAQTPILTENTEYTLSNPDDSVSNEPENDAVFCSQCGGKISADNSFCPYCGKPVSR